MTWSLSTSVGSWTSSNTWRCSSERRSRRSVAGTTSCAPRPVGHGRTHARDADLNGARWIVGRFFGPVWSPVLLVSSFHLVWCSPGLDVHWFARFISLKRANPPILIYSLVSDRVNEKLRTLGNALWRRMNIGALVRSGMKDITLHVSPSLASPSPSRVHFCELLSRHLVSPQFLLYLSRVSVAGTTYDDWFSGAE